PERGRRRRQHGTGTRRTGAPATRHAGRPGADPDEGESETTKPTRRPPARGAPSTGGEPGGRREQPGGPR
ncbi:hypothetical protein C3R44_21265, partial [Mycobacterium tuberculosis]